MEVMFLLAYAAFLLPTTAYLIHIYRNPEHTLHFAGYAAIEGESRQVTMNARKMAQREVLILMVLLALTTFFYLRMISFTF